MAYIIQSKKETLQLKRLPLQYKSKTGLLCEVVRVNAQDDKELETLYKIFNQVIEEGQTYPQDNIHTYQEFKAYFCSHDLFCCRNVETKQIYGSFYIKPNYPGRSSHFCNGGFIVDKNARNQGVGVMMATSFLILARDLGYRASYFNLVYVTNPPSWKLWDKLGFTRINTVPQVGRLKGFDYYVDAYQYYYNLTNIKFDNLTPQETIKNFSNQPNPKL